jgi:hypothetical protein
VDEQARLALSANGMDGKNTISIRVIRDTKFENIRHKGLKIRHTGLKISLP